MDLLEQVIKVPAHQSRHRYSMLRVYLERAAKRHRGDLHSVECLGPLKWLAKFKPIDETVRKAA